MSTTTNIIAISRYTFIENLKKRNFLILFLFIFVMLGSGILFSVLSPLQKIRVILDIGTSSIEMFSFLSCAFIAVRVILQEMETKTVYLILSRPITRSTYIIGRYLGIITIMAVYISIMTVCLTLVLLSKGWNWNIYIVGISLSIFLKVIIVSSFSILLSLISTSSISSFVSIFFLWTLGHFSIELKYIISILKNSGNSAHYLLSFFYYLIPNFSLLNYKDFFHIKSFLTADFFFISAYAIFYSALLVAASILIFNKKEL